MKPYAAYMGLTFIAEDQDEADDIVAQWAESAEREVALYSDAFQTVDGPLEVLSKTAAAVSATGDEAEEERAH